MQKIIDGQKVDYIKTGFESCNCIGVEVGTNIGKDDEGDSGYGYRTFFRIIDGASTDMRIVLKHDFDKETTFNQILDDERLEFSIDDIELRFGGCTELDTFIQALKFAYDFLSNKRK